MKPKVFLSQDGDSHWYVVLADKRKEWEAWRDIPSDDQRSWTVPDFAKELAISPQLVEFYDEEINRWDL